MADEAKPQCGGGVETGAYDVPLHVGGLFIVMIASILGAGFPVVAKKVPSVKVPQKVFFACKHFGTGVLIATAFVHLLPESFGSLTDPCLPDVLIEDYPAMPGVIMMGAMFMLFTVEMWLHGKTGGHSHGNPNGDITAAPRRSMIMGVNGMPAAPPRPPRPDASFDYGDNERGTILDYEKAMAYQADMEKERYPYVTNPFDDPNNVVLPQSEMPAWFVVFYEQYVRQRLELMNMVAKSNAKNEKDHRRMMEHAREQVRALETSSDNSKLQVPTINVSAPAAKNFDFDLEEQQVDPEVLRKMSLNISLLEGGILFHSVFVGITVSLTIEGYLILVIAIVFHQMFEGLGLGSRIAEVPYPKSSMRPWILVLAFGTTAPLGMGLGIALNGTYDPDSAFGLILVGCFNAFSFGLLVWAALVDLLAEDFLSDEADRVMTPKSKKIAFCWVLLGAAAMAIIGAFA
ncbi:zinc-regulated transporter 2 [Sarocladium strictum]